MAGNGAAIDKRAPFQRRGFRSHRGPAERLARTSRNPRHRPSCRAKPCAFDNGDMMAMALPSKRQLPETKLSCCGQPLAGFDKGRAPRRGQDMAVPRLPFQPAASRASNSTSQVCSLARLKAPAFQLAVFRKPSEPAVFLAALGVRNLIPARSDRCPKVEGGAFPGVRMETWASCLASWFQNGPFTFRRVKQNGTI